MDSRNLGNNCYRAILAQVNSLEAVWPESSYLKQIYEDLTEYFIEVRMIISELKTHLEFLRLEYEKDYPSQYLCNPD